MFYLSFEFFLTQRSTVWKHYTVHPLDDIHLNKNNRFCTGESACSHGEALVPVSVSMSSVRKKKDLDQGPDMCVDGDLETMCTTNRKAYSSITLDFGEPVEIAKVIAHKDERCLIES